MKSFLSFENNLGSTSCIIHQFQSQIIHIQYTRMSHLKITIKSTKSGNGLYCIACTGYKLSFFLQLKINKELPQTNHYHKRVKA